jgi:hypothetical protein
VTIPVALGAPHRFAVARDRFGPDRFSSGAQLCDQIVSVAFRQNYEVLVNHDALFSGFDFHRQIPFNPGGNVTARFGAFSFAHASGF